MPYNTKRHVLTENNGPLARQLVSEVARAENTEPRAELEDSDEPALGASVADGGAHAVIERLHAVLD